jgi:hypothetical protein
MQTREEPHPFDRLNVTIPGRIMACELLVRLLLARDPERAALARRADARLAELETIIHAEGLGQADDRALKIFAAAREALDLAVAEAEAIAKGG